MTMYIVICELCDGKFDRYQTYATDKAEAESQIARLGDFVSVAAFNWDLVCRCGI